MATLTGLMDMSLNALKANQTAVDITSNNVANANTPGYTNEVAQWQEVDYVSLSGTSTPGGATVSASSQRDRVLEQRVQQQTQLQASSSIESDALTGAESVFGLSSTSTSSSSTIIGSDINALFNSFSSLESNPSDNSLRQAVISAAGTFAADISSAAGQISGQRATLGLQVSSTVTQVNALTASIAKLNAQITSTSPNGDAGTLEDQRQQDLTQLSQLIGFNQTTTEGNGLTLTTANGTVLVGEGNSYPLTTAVVNGNLDVFSTSPTSTDITSSITGGQIGGALKARDQDLPQVLNSLDALAYGVGSQINAQNAAGLDANGNAGGALFTLPSTASGAASTIALATSNVSAIAASGSGQGSTGSSNAAALSNLQGAGVVNGQTATSFFASFLTQLGSTVSAASDNNTVQQASLTQLTTQRNALSGVSMDQEAANLSQYQNSYEAAAKVFSIINTLFVSALNLGEQTTVS